MNLEYYRDQLWNLVQTRSAEWCQCWNLPLCCLWWQIRRCSICDGVSPTKAQLLYFGLLCSSTEIELELVLLLSLASDGLWWGVLTAFVRSPKRLLEWPLCRRGMILPCSLFPALLAWLTITQVRKPVHSSQRFHHLHCPCDLLDLL